MVSVAKCGLMWQKVIPSLAQLTRKSMLLIIFFNCNDIRIIYWLTCNKCKMQYVGKTVDEFLLRWSNYKDRKHFRKAPYMQLQLFEHFSSEGHSSFLDDVSIIFVDKTDSKDPNKREHYWPHILKKNKTSRVECRSWLILAVLFYLYIPYYF